MCVCVCGGGGGEFCNFCFSLADVSSCCSRVLQFKMSLNEKVACCIIKITIWTHASAALGRPDVQKSVKIRWKLGVTSSEPH